MAIIGKEKLTKTIAKQSKLTQKQSAEVFDTTLSAIREALSEGDEVRLVGFGSFKVRRCAARKGQNPQTLAPLEIPERNRVFFSVGKDLSEAAQKAKK